MSDGAENTFWDDDDDDDDDDEEEPADGESSFSRHAWPCRGGSTRIVRTGRR